MDSIFLKIFFIIIYESITVTITIIIIIIIIYIDHVSYKT